MAVDRPEWAKYLYDEEDKEKRKSNWETHHLTQAQLAEWGPNAINFYFAFIKHNHEAMALQKSLRHDKGFNLVENIWYLISEVENGGWGQYFWNSASEKKAFERTTLFKPTQDCLEKLYAQFPVGADLHRSEKSTVSKGFNMWGSEDGNTAELMKKALELFNKQFLIEKMTQFSKNERITGFQQFGPRCP
eukprot:Phypoly_transcript_16526.p1 GENE.Phypoly_transcript_16526~~Phypoly_transcript_16526.p1  ORF type:complete len:190 (+),score=26.39 Phypoly_transcript_16526:109-678(+)